HGVARQPAAHEDHEAVEPGDAVPSERERVDRQLELLVAADGNSHGRRLAAGMYTRCQAPSGPPGAAHPARNCSVPAFAPGGARRRYESATSCAQTMRFVGSRGRLALAGGMPGRTERPPGRRRVGGSGQDGDVHRSGTRAVELAEEDALPGTERQAAASQRHDHLRPHQRRADMRRRVLLALLDVLPAPLVADDPLERRLEVAADGRVGVLVDRQARRRVRHVDEHRRAVDARDRLDDGTRDVEHLRSALGGDGELAHGGLSYGPMSVEAPTTRELDTIREDADRFVAELNEEFYLHYAGLKPTLDVEPVYERHEELTRLETATRLAAAPTELWRFACEGFLGNLTREHQARAAGVEASLEATVDGETVPYRMLRVTLANEPDRDRRRRLEEARVRLLDEHLNPVYLEAFAIDRGAVQQLGAPNYYELYTRFGFRLAELADECRAVLDETERLWETE